MLTDQKARKLLLQHQAHWRRQGKDSAWLQGYARGFLRVGEKLKTKRKTYEGAR